MDMGGEFCDQSAVVDAVQASFVAAIVFKVALETNIAIEVRKFDVILLTCQNQYPTFY